MKKFAIIITLTIFLISCDNSTMINEKLKENHQTENRIDTSEKLILNIEYSIIKVDKIPNEKYSIDIRLEKEYKKTELEEFAYYVKNELITEDYTRVFISYYLPNMKVGQGAWATSHFNPELEIIMSSPFYDNTKEKEKVNLSKTDIAVNTFLSKNSSCEIIGKWYQGNNFLMFIFKKNEKYNLKEMNISTLKIGKNYELIEKKVNGKQAFIIKEFLEGTNVGSDVELIGEFTDYYLIEKNGDLALYDNIGIIEKYRKIN